jgi:hypothetical protein
MYLQPLDEWLHATYEDPRPRVVISLVSLCFGSNRKNKRNIWASSLRALATESRIWYPSFTAYRPSRAFFLFLPMLFLILGITASFFFIISSSKLHGIVRSDQLLADPLLLSNLGVSDSKIWPGCNPLRILILGGSIPKIVEGVGKQISGGNLKCIRYMACSGGQHRPPPKIIWLPPLAHLLNITAKKSSGLAAVDPWRGPRHHYLVSSGGHWCNTGNIHWNVMLNFCLLYSPTHHVLNSHEFPDVFV